MSHQGKTLSLFIAALLLSTMIFTSAYADELLSLKVGYQTLSPHGDISGSTAGDRRLSVKRDLDFDDSGGLTGEIALNWGRSRLSLNYLPISFSGTSTIKVDGTFNNRTFSINDTIKSDVDIALYDVGYSYYLINMDSLPVRLQLGAELAVKIADAEVLFRNLNLDNLFTEKESALVPIPTLGLRGRAALSDFIGITARVGYMEYSDNHFLDAEAQVEFSPVPLMGVYAGYRYFDLKIDESDVRVDMDFSGPFAGLLVRF